MSAVAVEPPPFRNEPPLELRRADNRAALADALAAVDRRLPIEVPVIVGGERRSGEGFASTDPGAPARVIATAAEASEVEVAAAVQAAAEAGSAWARTPATDRAARLIKAAELLRARRLELAALEVRECAKPWPEADADVCEAIDFLEYYAREAIRLDAGAPVAQAPGERNSMRYVARGVAAVISPWNFPIAIPTGMVSAALAVGNGVVLKPAEQSPATALALVEALQEADVAPGAISLLPGHGPVGAALVRHPGVHVIAFTGSSAVGLEILREAATPRQGQSHIKRVVAEMGGKNCVIVDSDADLDEAVPGIVRSAFVYAGQKCSAAARVLAHEEVAEPLAARLAGAIELLRVGQASELETDVPAVIEAQAQERVLGYIERARSDGRILASAPAPESAGWFCPPTLAGELDPASPVLREEIFGPLLTVEAVPSVEAACEAVERLPFALTGGLFSRDPATVAEVSRTLPVGNLYVNRHTTGAMVGRQPFGGNKLSGSGSKAGGPDYLLNFVEPRVVTENTTRHGLVVE
ncbi:MAG TPA: aldehyde dehydrogenase family protein [Solirubrobacterales bacterium]|nr:aldehyde dehydrogenase family protein [Solirubrobacterales bacterium]